MELILSWIGLPLISALTLGYFEFLTRLKEESMKDNENWNENWKLREERKERRTNYFIILFMATAMNVGYMAGMEISKWLQ